MGMNRETVAMLYQSDVNGLCKWSHNILIREVLMKATENEDEYIARMEFEKKKRIEEEKHRQLDSAEQTRLKELHFMRCPKCGMELIEIDYKGIKIDECSECYGIWLDAGELSVVSKLERGALDKLFSIFKSS